MAADVPPLPAGEHSLATVLGPAGDVGPGRPSIWVTLLVGLLGPLLTSFVATGLVLLVGAFVPHPGAHTGLQTLRSAPGLASILLLQNALIALWAWRLAQDRELPARYWLRLTRPRIDLLDVVLLLLLSGGVFALGGFASHWAREHGLVSDLDTVKNLSESFRNAPGISWLVLVVAMGVGPGIGEEIWMRGHVLRALQTRYRTSWAVLTSAALFASLHLSPSLIVFALPFGLVFGWLAVRMDSIVPGIFCHALVNSSVNLIRAIKVRTPGYIPKLGTEALGSKELALVWALMAAGLIAGLWLEYRFRQAAARAKGITAPSAPAGELR